MSQELPAWVQEALNDPELLEAAKRAVERIGPIPNVITRKTDWTDKELMDSIAEDDYILGEKPEPATPMTWDAFLKKAVAEGWTASDYWVSNEFKNGVRVLIYKVAGMDIGESNFDIVSYELALDAANTAARATGGWK